METKQFKLMKSMIEVEIERLPNRWVYVYLSENLYNVICEKINDLKICNKNLEDKKSVERNDMIINLLNKLKDGLFYKYTLGDYIKYEYFDFFDFQNMNKENKENINDGDDLLFVIEKECCRIKRILSVLQEIIKISYNNCIHYKKRGVEIIFYLENFFMGYEKVLKIIEEFKIQYNNLKTL